MNNEQKPFVPKTPMDFQKLKLERLMANPDKPVLIPEMPKEKKGFTVPEFVRNVMGSSAGAGSGEFHVYRHLRRKEYTRQKMIEEKAEKERLDEEFRKKLEENKRKMEERTAKRRAKRLKKKEKLKSKAQTKGSKKANIDKTSDKSNSETDSSDKEGCSDEHNSAYTEEDSRTSLSEIVDKHKKSESEDDTCDVNNSKDCDNNSANESS